MTINTPETVTRINRMPEIYKPVTMEMARIAYTCMASFHHDVVIDAFTLSRDAQPGQSWIWLVRCTGTHLWRLTDEMDPEETDDLVGYYTQADTEPYRVYALGIVARRPDSPFVDGTLRPLLRYDAGQMRQGMGEDSRP